MLSPRAEIILKSIIEQYITRATPVPSHSLVDDGELGISPATVRNEMAHLEEEGYITRPHVSAGSIPLDKGYRYYVESLGEVKLSSPEQIFVSHLFHQLEKELEEWLNLAAAIVARMVQNVAIITLPKRNAAQFKHLELVSLHDFLALVVLVLHGAKVRQQLLTFEQVITQPELTALAGKLSAGLAGLTRSQILSGDIRLSPIEQQVTDCVEKMMEVEDNQEQERSSFAGLHFTLNQPEFVQNHLMTVALMELLEQRNLKSIVPATPYNVRARVIIGKENVSEAVQHCSLVVRQYGLAGKALGTVGVIGPTRMPYDRTIATVDYLASMLSELVANLYGREMSSN
ncbi:MAG: heat-inducible transcriptional repressor HrcA [Chloroflexota bacterium]